MSNQQTVLTALGCAGSLAAMLAMGSPALANSTTAALTDESTSAIPSLAQNESNPITDALGCTCARCTMVEQQTIF